MRKQFTGLVASFAELNFAAIARFVDDEKLESRAINYVSFLISILLQYG